MMSNYAGVDWAADKHDVRVADETGEELLAATFAHDEKGLRALVPHARAAEGGAGGDRAAGRAAGRAAAGRGAAGAADASQPGRGDSRLGSGPAGGKSDRFDAFVLCELARTDSHRFRVLEPDSDRPRRCGR